MLVERKITPTGIYLNAELLELESYLNKNIALAPTGTAPQHESDEAKAIHQTAVKEYKSKLIEFNEKLQKLIEDTQKSNLDTATRLSENHRATTDFNNHISLMIETELTRIISLTSLEMRKSSFYESWINGIRNKLWMQYGFGM